LNIFINQQNR